MPAVTLPRSLSRGLALAVTAALLALLAPLLGLRAAHAAGPVPTQLRISAPANVSAGTRADVSARLLDAAGGVDGATVVIQREAPSGWVQVGSLTTRSGGLGHVAIAVGTAHRYRAFFRGDVARTAAISRNVVSAAVSTLGQRAVAEARRHAGAPYLWGATGPNRFDCSGLTLYVFRRLGHNLPRTAAEQAHATRRVPNSAKRPGDLIFLYHGSTIGHVGIYAGGSQIWAAPQTGDHVRLQSFAGRRYIVGRVG